ncbi:MAG: hypothetical protein B5M56_09595 [Desulfococcus sp. 4484_241]|nr:MAG: hypothetical protein B5M56_09595 [Desulfococcus sp. 4484_241]
MYEKRSLAYIDACKLHDEHTATLELACSQGCSDCCTINVAVTSLEACIIAEHIDRLANKDELWGKLENAKNRNRFIPRLTFNRVADLYEAGEALPPEDDPDPAWGACPLLVDNHCPIYEYRPFACRAMVSSLTCSGKGFAEMSPLTVSVNTVLYQYIEDLDRAGVSGNMVDMLLYMRPPENRKAYKEGKKISSKQWCVNNSRLTVIMADPAHRKQLEPILESLKRF